MSVTPFDSALYGRAFADADIARLFSDSAEIRAMLLFWGALGPAQAEHGLIPAESGAAIHRAAMEVQIDAASLADATAANGIPVPGLLAAFRAAMQAPEHARWVHHGATTQDVVDTGLALRLRQALTLVEARVEAALDTLAALAEAHAETPMAARTWGQVATPTTFGAVVASWGEALLAARETLPRVRDGVQVVTLHGASGTLSAMGAEGPRIRAALARALSLGDPHHAPHADRHHVRALAGWLADTLAALDKLATDLLLLTRDGAVGLASGGVSSTMPQKSNPVAPSQIRGLALHGGALAASMRAAHWDQRDGGAWFAEWLALPQMLTATGRALTLAAELDVRPDATLLRAPLDDPSGLVHAEAISFAMPGPRPAAQAQVKEWVAQVRESGGSLVALSRLDPALFAPQAQWGEAPDHARRFVARARSA